MKLTKLFSKLWLSAAALLAFSACSNEDLPTQTTSEAPKTKKVRVEFTATKDNDNLRAVFGVNTSNADGQLTDLIMPEKDVVIRVAVKQGTGYPIVQDITFKKAKGRNYATYAGDITVPTGGSGNYKVSGILLNEVDGETFLSHATSFPTPTQLTSESDLDRAYAGRELDARVAVRAVDKKITLNVPYVTKWQDLAISGNVAQSTTFYLEPQGTILRMRIKNDATTEQTFQQIKFVTTAFVRAGGFRFDNTNGAVAWYTANDETQILSIPNGVTVAGNGGYSEWLYCWVMPRRLEQVQRYTVASLSQSTSVAPLGFTVAFSTDQQLPTGSVPMTLVYSTGHNAVIGTLPELGEEWGSPTTAPKMAIEYLSEYAVNKAGTGFVTDATLSNSDLGYFSWGGNRSQLEALSQGITIAGTKWHLPTRDELAGIFPIEYDATGIGSGKFIVGTTVLNVVETSIKIGSVTQNYAADYYSTSTKLYGLRFKNKSNKWRTAFRYSLGGSSATNDLHMLVECIYVGAENITLDDIKNDTNFWTARASEIKSRRFPLYGVERPGQGVINRGLAGNITTATQYDEAAYYLVNISQRSARLMPASISNGLPAFLFKN